MSATTFAVKVYNKGIRTDKAWKMVMWMFIPVMAFFLISSNFFTNEELNDSLFFKILFWPSLVFSFFIGILRIIDTQEMRPLGDLATLYVNERNIEYLDRSISFSSIVSITLVIEEKEKDRFRGGNNLLLIQTTVEELNLGLVIDSKDDLVNADKMIHFLKSKNVVVDYDRRFPLSI